MDFTIQCSCGHQLQVSAVDAGGAKRCPCGNVNAVPSLSALRRQAGQQSYEVKIADKLRYMFADGELPPNKECAQCGCKTANVLECSVECERPYSKGRGYWIAVLLGFIAPLLALLTMIGDGRNSEVHGQELVVRTPLPLCPGCAADLTLRRKRLIKLLCSVPLYAQLLEEYPQAAVAVLSQNKTK